MKLLFIVLNYEEYIEEVLALFLEVGVPGATVIDSVGMGHILAHDIPIFAGLRGMLAGNQPYNKTIFTVLGDDLCDEVINGVGNIMKTADHANLGIMFTLPVANFYSLSQFQ